MILCNVTVTYSWAPDGGGSNTVPSAQTLNLISTSYTVVPGGDAPTGSNLSTAASTAIAAFNYTAAAAEVDGWASGQP